MKKLNRENIQIVLTPEEVEIYKKCADDIIEFTKYIKIFNPRKRWINVYDNLYPKQKKILQDMQKGWQDHFMVLLSPRQSGKTTLVLIFILWLITFTESANVGILANKKDNAKKIFRRFAQMYRKLPDMFKLSDEIGDSKTELELADGTMVFCAATTRSGLRSESITFLYLDEFAFLQTKDLQNEFWQANYPILESMSGGLCVSSTPNGKDLFYDLVMKGKDKTDPKWMLLQINWKDVFERDEAWKAAKIKDLSVGGKDGREVFAQEYDCSFEIITDEIRFFNQDSINSYNIREPLYNWIPDIEYKGEPIRIFDELSNQHYLIGIDVSEGKGLNFSVMSGLSVVKKQLKTDYDVAVFETKQAFQYMNAFILPDDFFEFVFRFLIKELNDQWYLIVEANDVGRIFINDFSNLIEEINSMTFSKKNEFFKDILIDKFEGDTEQMSAYLNRRVYKMTGRKGSTQYGFKIDRKTNVDLKNNMKTIIDKKTISIYDNHLIEELRLFQDKRGGECITFDDVKGQGHFDCISALKLALWPLSSRDLVKDILGISPLKDTNISREQQYLDAVMNSNRRGTYKDHFQKELEKDNLDQMRDNLVPLDYREFKDMGLLTSNWKRRNLWRKR